MAGVSQAFYLHALTQTSPKPSLVCGITAPPTVPALIPGICEDGPFRGERDFADGIKDLEMGDYPRISRGVQCHHKSPCKSQRRRCDDRNRDQRETEREISGRGDGHAMLLALKMEKGPLAEEHGHC